jgi:hypothetical protein
VSEPTVNPTTYRILEAVRDALAHVRQETGYYTNLGLAPIALEGEQMPPDGVPHTVIVAGNFDIDDEKSGRSSIVSTMDIAIECEVPFAVTENAQLVAHRTRIDVLRALIPIRKDIKERPLGLNRFALIGGAFQQPEDGAESILVQVIARASLTETFNPPAA